MILINNGTNPLAHSGYVLPKGEKKEIPDHIAKEFLQIAGVEKYIEPADLEKAAKDAEKKAAKEIEALKKENEELKSKIADLEKAAKDAEKKTKEDKTSK